MKTLKNKTMAIMIALILILSMTTSLFALPTANGRNPPRVVKTFTYVAVSPMNPSVGEQSIIVFFSNFNPPTATGNYGDHWTFYVNVMKPDGTNDTLGPFESDPVGTGWTYYTPTQTGTYTVQSRMEQHTIDGGASRGAISPGGTSQDLLGDIYSASMSEPVTMTVTTEPKALYQESPLPTDYWTRPVYDTNRGWGSTVMGEWYNAGELHTFVKMGPYPGGGSIVPYSRGPQSSHILWTRQYWNGGTAGDQFGDIGYYNGIAYERFGGPYIILNGRFYYSVQTPPREGWYCCDLYTGQTIYYQNTTGTATSSTSNSGSIPNGAPRFAQVLDYETGNQHGVFSYLWVTSTGKTNTWDMLDDFSGSYICSIANVTWTEKNAANQSVTEGATGTAAYGTDGSILRYNIVNLGTTPAPNMYLQCWNTTQAIMYPSLLSGATTGSNVNLEWRPGLNVTYDGSKGLSQNVSIPNFPGSIRQIIPDDKLIGLYAGSNNGTFVVPGTVWAVSLKAGQLGKVLYNYNFTPPTGLGDPTASGGWGGHDTTFANLDATANIFWYVNPMLRIWYVLSLEDGHMLFQTPAGPQFDLYGYSACAYQGKFMTYGVGGLLIAYDAQTGKQLWNWSAPDVGAMENPYPLTPLWLAFITNDGTMYMYTSEGAGLNSPIRRDSMIWAVNSVTGKTVWNETFWPSGSPSGDAMGPIVGDGIIVDLDLHDNRIYGFGKGPSETTVSAPQTVPSLGSSVMITGTVTDQSPGAKGTPAISDSSMDAWMEYLYHQRPIPLNAEGVEISLDTIDPNGNYVHIGNVTSDSKGKYGHMFTPEVPGTYQIIATFAGSNSYGSSSDNTYMAVGEAAPTPAPTSQPVSLESTQTYIMAGIIAIIIAIAIVGTILALMLRKRP